MENTAIVVVESADVIELRNRVAEVNVRQYGAERAYAEKLCAVLPAEWYLVEAADKSDIAKPVHAEKSELYKVLKAAKHTNPSTVWARIRKYAQAYVEGDAPAKEGEGEGEGGNTKSARSLTLRMIEELTLLHKAGGREEFKSEKEKSALLYVAKALEALGIDLSTL